VHYGVHHIDTNEKKVEFFWKGLDAQLQDRLVLFHDLTYNALTSSVIDQEGTIQAYLDAVEKKRKRVMPGPSGGSSGGAPPKYRQFYTPHHPLTQQWGNHLQY
jgi:hypothetical protein